jgi:cation diffusion facilitator family transporter
MVLGWSYLKVDMRRHGHERVHPHRHIGSDLSPDKHSHSHGAVDPAIVSNERGLWAVKWSFVGLFITATLQLLVVILSHSVALLADTIHNFGDAGTAVPLGVAFLFASRPPNQRFPYGYGRVEDLAGLVVVLTILVSAIVAAYESVVRLLHPRAVEHLGAIAVASVLGFVGNELVAVFRIRVGKEIGSAALVADGYHARTDGWTSLAVLFGAIGVYAGYPKADPIIGLIITIAILAIVWQSARTVLIRMLDGVDADVVDGLRHAVDHVPGVLAVSDVRARWVGHRLRVEVNVSVSPEKSVTEGHHVAKQVEQQLRAHMPFVSGVIVHVDPVEEPGESHHIPVATV